MDERTTNPICPHCGHAERDAWEIDFGPSAEGETEATCGSCGEDYLVHREVDVYYRTSVIAAQQEPRHD